MSNINTSGSNGIHASSASSTSSHNSRETVANPFKRRIPHLNALVESYSLYKKANTDSKITDNERLARTSDAIAEIEKYLQAEKALGAAQALGVAQALEAVPASKHIKTQTRRLAEMQAQQKELINNIYRNATGKQSQKVINACKSFEEYIKDIRDKTNQIDPYVHTLLANLYYHQLDQYEQAAKHYYIAATAPGADENLRNSYTACCKKIIISNMQKASQCPGQSVNNKKVYYNIAHQHCKSALSLMANNHQGKPEMLNLIGICSHKIGLNAVALDYFNQAIKLNPQESRSYLNSINLSYELKEYRTGRLICQQVEKAIPGITNNPEYINLKNKIIALKQFPAANRPVTQIKIPKRRIEMLRSDEIKKPSPHAHKIRRVGSLNEINNRFKIIRPGTPIGVR